MRVLLVIDRKRLSNRDGQTNSDVEMTELVRELRIPRNLGEEAVKVLLNYFPLLDAFSVMALTIVFIVVILAHNGFDTYGVKHPDSGITMAD